MHGVVGREKEFRILFSWTPVVSQDACPISPRQSPSFSETGVGSDGLAACSPAATATPIHVCIAQASFQAQGQSAVVAPEWAAGPPKPKLYSLSLYGKTADQAPF